MIFKCCIFRAVDLRLVFFYYFSMRMESFNLSEDDVGRRIDRVVRRFLPRLSLSLIYKSIRTGRIKLNGGKFRSDKLTCAGDVLSVDARLLESGVTEKFFPSEAGERKSPESKIYGKSFSALKKGKLSEPWQSPVFLKDAARDEAKNPFSIVFRNEHALIVNKPSGVSVTGGEESLEHAVSSFLSADRKESSLSFSPGLSNRIDRSTSGLVIFSLSLKAANFFRLSLSEQKLKKEYLALVTGCGVKDGLYEMFLEKDEKEGGFHKVHALREGGRVARTRLFVLEENADFSFVKAELLTGRKHQLRALFSHLKHPIVGDTAYGASFYKRKHFIALHSWRLSFPENELGFPSYAEAIIPADFRELLLQNSFSLKV